MNKDFYPIIEKINTSQSIALLVHENPDGDAIGSIIAMNLALNGINKNVDAFIERHPVNCEFLLSSIGKDIKLFSQIDFGKKYDLCIVLDCGNLDRTGTGRIIFENSRDTICIDHHYTSNNFAGHNYVDENAAATGELVFDLLKKMNVILTEETATAIYSAVVSDTGNFKHSNTTKKTFEIAAELVEYGINITKISYYLFSETSLNRMKFMGNLLENIEIFLDGKVGVLTAKKENIEMFDIDDAELEGMVDYARYVRGVEVGIFIKPVDELIKVSMRSNGKIDVACIAEKFNGGGHKFAAGCKFDTEDYDEVRNRLLEELKNI